MPALSPKPPRPFGCILSFLLAGVLVLAPVPSLEAQQEFGQVVPSNAETEEGLFSVHRVDDRLLFEIPDAMLGRDMLLMSRYAATQTGLPLDGTQPGPEMVVRWEREGDRIRLRAISYEMDGDPEMPVFMAVERANFAPILASFPIEARGSGTSVIDASDLYLGGADVFEMGAQQKRAYEVRGLDRDRSELVSVRSFPQNIEVRSILTYAAANPPSQARGQSVSAKLNHSMILLPEEPMPRRWFDERVGLRGIAQMDYSQDHQGVKRVEYARRYWLEPSDMEAYQRGELVEPVEPWIWYIDPATPEEWVPYFKEGLLEWNEAYEKAGFRNAIQVRMAPTPEEDPDFSLEDARYSVVRYVATPVRSANAGGGAWDPRSGQLLRGHINMFHGLPERLRWWILSQLGGRHDDLRGDEISEEMMGEALRYVVSHEIAHVVGLPHNQMGNVAHPTDSLRSASFIEEMGHAASVVGRTRFNYVAQPGDDIPELERRRVGLADMWAVEWGHTVFPEYDSPDAEWPTLNQMVMERAEHRHFRFLEGQYIWHQEWDPQRMTEAMGDDLVKSSEYGLANLKRVMPDLVERVSRHGEDYSELEAHYMQFITQWARYVQHASVYVGGVYTHLKRYGEEGPVYTTVDRDHQLRAMDWLDEHAWTTPEWLLDKELLRLIEHAGALERIRAYHHQAMERFVQPNRLARMLEQEYFLGDQAYGAVEMMDDLRASLWKELAAGSSIDPFRRNLQRVYIDRLHWIMHEAETNYLRPPDSGNSRVSSDNDPPLNAELHVDHSDIRAIVRSQLRALRGEVSDGLGASADTMTRIHLEDVLVRIDRSLAEN